MRALLGPDKHIGASCYGDLQLALSALRSGASYVAFGCFYRSWLKQYPVATASDTIAQARAVIDLPVADV
ncbi:Thiamin-phosphate pyrophosphorylase [Oxalobacteraceae bacterium IMCC9480]|nr:Thiamin-phosphate pyrophosphorylase [Oxalobacteraceae bacterium IMCC9480]NDP57798.1 hypothetical protein [Oxalobacteraceae bacterium]